MEKIQNNKAYCDHLWRNVCFSQVTATTMAKDDFFIKTGQAGSYRNRARTEIK